MSREGQGDSVAGGKMQMIHNCPAQENTIDIMQFIERDVDSIPPDVAIVNERYECTHCNLVVELITTIEATAHSRLISGKLTYRQ